MINGKKTAGIIGGMGPLATADLFTKIVNMTLAEKDQDHVHLLIDNNIDIPDRTAAILSGGESPLPYLIASGNRLCEQGADFLLMPCNTAHYFWKPLQEAMTVPVLHMPKLTAEECQRRRLKAVGLLATTGTIQSGVYAAAFEGCGIDLIYPSEACANALMHLIYQEVKAGKEPRPEVIHPFLDEMQDLGADAFLLACTELPIAFAHDNAFPFIDPTEILAKEVILQCGGQLKARVDV